MTTIKHNYIMAKPKELESIKLLVEGEEGRKNSPAETNTPDADSVTVAKKALAETNTPNGGSVVEAQDAPEKEPKKKRRRRGKGNQKEESKGICPHSPIVRLLEEEKRFLKRLEAHILLETGETVSDHQLIMDAVREYTKKHHPDFQ